MEKNAVFPQSNDNHTDMKRTSVDTITCPYCSRIVTLVSYGSGWVGTCCGRVVYNNQTLPHRTLEELRKSFY